MFKLQASSLFCLLSFSVLSTASYHRSQPRDLLPPLPLLSSPGFPSGGLGQGPPTILLVIPPPPPSFLSLSPNQGSIGYQSSSLLGGLLGGGEIQSPNSVQGPLAILTNILENLRGILGGQFPLDNLLNILGPLSVGKAPNSALSGLPGVSQLQGLLSNIPVASSVINAGSQLPNIIGGVTSGALGGATSGVLGGSPPAGLLGGAVSGVLGGSPPAGLLGGAASGVLGGSPPAGLLGGAASGLLGSPPPPPPLLSGLLGG